MSDAEQAVEPQAAPCGPQMRLSLVPQEPRFVVRVPVRIPRTGSVPIQLALPRRFHQRLRVGTSGSLNHALIALVRQAFAWLDADRVSLRIHAAHDPLTATSTGRTAAQSDARDAVLEAPANWQLPHAMFEPIAPDEQVLVEVRGRPSRQDIIYIQVGLPADIPHRLQEHGLGSISQLVAYLARYAYLRLQTEKLSLHVTVIDADADDKEHVAVTDDKKVEPPQPTSKTIMSSAWQDPIVARPIATVGELIEHLRKFPTDTLVGLADTGFEVNSGIVGLSIDRAPRPTGTLMLIGDFQAGILAYMENSE